MEVAKQRSFIYKGFALMGFKIILESSILSQCATSASLRNCLLGPFMFRHFKEPMASGRVDSDGIRMFLELLFKNGA